MVQNLHPDPFYTIGFCTIGFFKQNKASHARSQNSILKLEIEVRSRNSKLKPEVETRNRNSKSKLQIETWNRNSKPKPDIKTWNRNSKLKPEIETLNRIIFTSILDTIGIFYLIHWTLLWPLNLISFSKFVIYSLFACGFFRFF